MKKGCRSAFGNKYLAAVVLLVLLVSSFVANGQAIFNPGYTPLFTVSNKPYALSQGAPVDGRSYKADSINFLWRPYNGTTEVLSYLPSTIPKYRTGQFPIEVNVGGALQSNGSFIGGQIFEYWFRNGTADSNLVLKAPISNTCVGCLLAPNNLSDVANASLALQNLGAGNMATQNIIAGGDLSGNWPNPTVSKFNGQLPAFYLNYLNLTNTPAIPAQLNPSQLGLVQITGTYPNLTFNGVTPSFEQTLLKLNTTSQLDSINIGNFVFRIFGTSALGIPGGTTAQRPGSPSFGDTRANTDSVGSPLETWNGSAWVHPSGGSGGGGSGITALTGDVLASGTGSVPATLATVNSNVFASNTPLKFSVNGKGLVTAAVALAPVDIKNILGYTPYDSLNPKGYIPLTALSGVNGINFNNTTGVISGISFDNIAAINSTAAVTGATINVRGYNTIGDGGQGDFIWNATSTATPVQGMIIQISGITTGRLFRQWDGYHLNALWFGIVGDSSTDNTAAEQVALNFQANTQVYFPSPAKAYLSLNNVYLNTSGVWILGQDREGTKFVQPAGNSYNGGARLHFMWMLANVKNNGGVKNIRIENVNMLDLDTVTVIGGISTQASIIGNLGDTASVGLTGSVDSNIVINNCYFSCPFGHSQALTIGSHRSGFGKFLYAYSVTNSYFENCASTGIGITSELAVVWAVRLNVSNNSFINIGQGFPAGAFALDFAGAENFCNAENNYFENIAGIGIEMGCVSFSNITGNKYHNCTGTGSLACFPWTVNALGSSIVSSIKGVGNTVENNIVDDSTYGAPYYYNQDRLLVKGNRYQTAASGTGLSTVNIESISNSRFEGEHISMPNFSGSGLVMITLGNKSGTGPASGYGVDKNITFAGEHFNTNTGDAAVVGIADSSNNILFSNCTVNNFTTLVSNVTPTNLNNYWEDCLNAMTGQIFNYGTPNSNTIVSVFGMNSDSSKKQITVSQLGALIGGGGGSQLLTYTPNPTNNNLAISGGNSVNFLPATTANAGLEDTTAKHLLDSIHNRLLIFNLAAINGIQPIGTTGDSLGQGGRLMQNTTVSGANAFAYILDSMKAQSGKGFKINFGSDAGWDMFVKDSATGFWTRIPKGTLNQVLSFGSGGPVWSTPAASGITQLTGDVTAGPGAGSQVATISALAVTTGKIAANAVTLPKLSTGPSNQLIGYDGSGNPTAVSLTTTGTSGPSSIVGGILNIPQYGSVGTFDTLKFEHIICANDAPWNADNTGAVDAGAAIQAALFWMDSVYGGGTVYLRNGHYKISDTLQTLKGNCQICFPTHPYLGGIKNSMLRLRGESANVTNGSGYAAGVSISSQQGVILTSTITGSGTNPSIIGTTIFAGGNAFNPITSFLENIVVRAYTNHATAPVSINGIFWPLMNCSRGDNVWVSTDTANELTQNPINSEFAGITFGAFDDDGPNNWSNSGVIGGFKYGWVISGDHTNVNNLYSWANVYGYAFPEMAYPLTGKILVQACNVGVLFPKSNMFGGALIAGHATVNLSLEIEQDISGSLWYNYGGNSLGQWDVNDSSNLGQGIIWQSCADSAGIGTFRQFNGGNLTVYDLYNHTYNSPLSITTPGGLNNLSLPNGLTIKSTSSASYSPFNLFNNTGSGLSATMAGSSFSGCNNCASIENLITGGNFGLGTHVSPGLIEMYDGTPSNVVIGSSGNNANSRVSDILQLNSTSQAFGPPSMTTTQKLAIPSPHDGDMVYDVTLHSGYQYYSPGSLWLPFGQLTSIGGNFNDLLVVRNSTVQSIASDSLIFNSGNLGINSGGTPAHLITATLSQNATTDLNLINKNAGTAASVGLLLTNDGLSDYEMKVKSSGFTPSGVLKPNVFYMYSSNAAGLVLDHDGSGAPLVFAHNSVTEEARFFSTGNFAIASTTDNSAFLQIGANTTTNAQIFLNGSAADVTSPTQGMLRYITTGTHHLYFRDNGADVDLLAGGSTPTWDAVLAAGATLSTNRTITNTGHTLTHTGGTDDYTGATILVTTQSPLDNSTNAASTAYVNAAATSGTYTPTLTGTANVSSVTLSNATYIKIGNIVQVTVGGTIVPSLGSTITSFNFTLPFTTSNGSQGNAGSGVVVMNSGVAQTTAACGVNSTTTGGFAAIPVTTTGDSFSITMQYTL